MTEQRIRVNQEQGERQIPVAQQASERSVCVNGEPSVLHGIDGVSPIATVTQTEDGAVISITDRDGTTTAEIKNGEQGAQGDPGQAATIAVGSTTTGSAGSNATVVNSGTSNAAILDFTIPRGDTGAPGKDGVDGKDGIDGRDGVDGKDGKDGLAATVTVGSTTTGQAGTNASVTNSGTSSAAVLNFTIPRGADGQDGQNGRDGSDGKDGKDGLAATISVGTVTTGQAGTSASVTNSGTSSAAVFNFTIPRGDTGATGADGYSPTASVSKSGDTATITITDKNGTTTAAVTDGATPTIDNALSWTSTNPVENQAIRKTIFVKNSSDDKEAGINIAFSNPNLNPYVHIGSKTGSTKGNKSVGIGYNSESSAVRSVAIGDSATASKREGVALGPSATAGQYSLSIGYNTNTVPNYSTAVGPYAKVLTGATNATAIGYQSEADEAETVSVGKSTNKRRIVNVANGTTATDAATVGQIPTKTSDLTNDGADNTSTYVEADELATVATSGLYSDLTGTPTIPAAQVNSDWNSNSGVSQILNKPSLATVATSGSYSDLTNKPTIPTVNNATLTIQKNGTNVQTFTANQSTDAIANIAVPTKTSDLTNDGSDNTAAYLETDETAYRTASIPYGVVDNTSTSTAFTATVPGITALRDGVCMWLKNGVVTSATGFTININGLGAKPSYSNMAAAAQDSTIFDINYTMLFVYDSTRVAGGCWVCYRGYNSDTNTIGYQLRTNSTALTVTDRTRYYRVLFTSADNTQWVPANTQYDNSATSNKTVNQRKINPFGRIVYLSNTTSYVAGAAVSATAVWDQYAFNLGYSFSKGSALTMTYPKPVYIKAAPQTDGSAIIDSTNPYVQDLPTTEDGKIYVYLGIAYSDTNVEMVINHPIYYYKDGAIREWSNAPAAIASVAWGDITGTLSNQTDLNTALGAKANSADLATVATSGSYNDLTNKPTIPTAQVNSDWNSTSGVSEILNKPTLSTVATTGAYGDLTGTPNLATVATSGSYNDLSNKPTIPTVNNATLTIQKNGTSVGTFTANASANVTANITVPTQTSDLTNNSGFLTSSTAVTSFNGSTGAITYTAPVTSVNGSTGAITGLQTTGNLVTSVSGSSTDSQYPSAKLFYDTIGNVETILQTLNNGGGAQ